MLRDKYIVIVVISLLLFFLITGFPVYKAQAKKEKDTPDITEAELQRMVMSFADTYASFLIQSNKDFQRRFSSYELRAEIIEMTVASILTATDIAAGPDALFSLLDMVVLVTLQRITWEEYWQPKVFGKKADFWLETFRLAEKELGKVAETVYSPEQLQILQNLIQEWRKVHPDQNIVVNIRFADFRKLEKLYEQAHKRLLFPSIKKALETADEIRLLGERFRYQSSRMQRILNLQLELGYVQLIEKHEVEGLIQQASKFVAATEQLAQTASQLPEMTKYVFKEFETESERFRRLLDELQQTLVAGDKLVAEVNTTITSVDSLISRFDPIRRDVGKKPIDIQQYREAAKDFTETGRQFRILLESIDHFLSSPDKKKRLTYIVEAVGKVEAQGERLINHIYYRTIILVIIIFIGSFITILAYRIISKKIFGSDFKGNFSI